MTDRDEQLQAIRGSSALEDLHASEETRRLLDQWAAGEKSYEDLDAAARRIIEAAQTQSQAS